MSAPTAKFILSRAKAEDMEEIIDLCYESFSREETNLYMGCPDRTNVPKYRQRCLDIMESDKSDVWMHVKDAETGKMVACSNWKVYANGKPDDHGEEVIDWAGPEQQELSAKVVKFMNENRWKNMTGPFVHLHICFTSPQYRRMGAGALMMQWGVDLMDSLFLPGWIEASPDGNKLYKTFGFYVHETVDINGSPVANMRRDVRSRGIEGSGTKKA